MVENLKSFAPLELVASAETIPNDPPSNADATATEIAPGETVALAKPNRKLDLIATAAERAGYSLCHRHSHNNGDLLVMIFQRKNG